MFWDPSWLICFSFSLLGNNGMNLLILPFSPSSLLCPLSPSYPVFLCTLRLEYPLASLQQYSKTRTLATPSLCLAHVCTWVNEDGHYVCQSGLSKAIQNIQPHRLLWFKFLTMGLSGSSVSQPILLYLHRLSSSKMAAHPFLYFPRPNAFPHPYCLYGRPWFSLYRESWICQESASCLSLRLLPTPSFSTMHLPSCLLLRWPFLTLALPPVPQRPLFPL